MFNSTVLEVAGGLVFCYASIALISSSVFEAVASWFNLRSKILMAGLVKLLNAKSGFGQDLLLRIYNDALVHPTGDGTAKTLGEIKNKPAYIPPKSFALSLMHAIQPATTNTRDLPRDINSVKDEQLRALLQKLYEKAAGKVEVFENELAIWFDQAMDRLSGVYKKQSQIGCFIIAFVLAVGFNVDSVHLFKILWLHPSAIAELHVPSVTQTLAEDARTQLRVLPIGWNNGFEISMLFSPSAIVGWLLTASASLFGAPFWFDFLKAVVNLRGTGTKPEAELKRQPTETQTK